jgi:NADPH:quinone reductase-like Zn-dependent oxidoreductase
VIHENGDIGAIKVEDIADPAVGPDEVVVRLQAAALNHLDIWVRRGRPGLELSWPHVLGSDGTGTVVEVGPDVREVSVGDAVVINPGLSCGTCEYCRRGEQSECLTFGIIGMNSPGTFAEYVAVPAVNVERRPGYLPPAEAAALPLAHLTAWRMLMTKAGLRPGETVLIHGIGGGVALAGLQIARLAGAHAIVTSSSDEKLARARELGAEDGVNYANHSDVAGAVRDLTGGRGVDVAFDTVGAATWPINFAAVRRGGRIVHCGVTSGAQTEANISSLYWNHLNVMGSTMGSHEDFRQLINAAEAVELHPVVDSIEPLTRIRPAMGRMEEGNQFGKIVVRTGGVGAAVEAALEAQAPLGAPEPEREGGGRR